MINRDMQARIKPDDLPNEELKDIAQLVGIEAAIKLLNKFSGQTVYFPKFWAKNFLQKYVSEEWDGENARDLCKQLGVSYSTIYRAANKKVIRAPLREPRIKAGTQQLDFFSTTKPRHE